MTAPLAVRLGHGKVQTFPTKSGRRWYGVCSCGYVSRTRTSEQLAGAALMYHVSGALSRARSNGIA